MRTVCDVASSPKPGNELVVPISLLPIFSKILEKLIYESLYLHLEREDLLNPNQSGFRLGD